MTLVATKNKIQEDRNRLLQAVKTWLVAYQRRDLPLSKKKVAFKIYLALKSDEGEFFVSYSQEENGKIAYARRPEYRFDTKRRTRTTFGRFVRRVLKISEKEMTDALLDHLGNEVTSAAMPVDDLMTIFNGDSIVEAYEEKIGFETCMTGPYAKFTRIYAKNPDVVSLVIFGDNEARALLWNTCEGKQVLDRIYPNDGSHINSYQRWAKQHDIVYRSNNSAPSGEGVQLSDYGMYSITLDHWAVKNFPYMDTFQWGKFMNGQILLKNRYDNHPVRLSSASGYFNGWCWECRNAPSEVCVDHVSVCKRCCEKHYVSCAGCSRQVRYENIFSFPDPMTGETMAFCRHCLHSNSFYCSCCDRRFKREERVCVIGTFPSFDQRNNHGYEPVCYECAVGPIFQCLECCDSFEGRALYFSESRGWAEIKSLRGPYCPSCYNARVGRSMRVCWHCGIPNGKNADPYQNVCNDCRR